MHESTTKTRQGAHFAQGAQKNQPCRRRRRRTGGCFLTDTGEPCGRGPTGGIINQVSKAPSLDPSYNGIFSGGSGRYFRGTVDVNQPISEVLPNAAFRINLMGQRADVVDRDKVEGNRQGFAPSVSF